LIGSGGGDRNRGPGGGRPLPLTRGDAQINQESKRASVNHSYS
jgi:hypothetical protein